MSHAWHEAAETWLNAAACLPHRWPTDIRAPSPSDSAFVWLHSSDFLTFHPSPFDVWSNYTQHQIRQICSLDAEGPATEEKGTERTFQHESMWNQLPLNMLCAIQLITASCCLFRRHQGEEVFVCLFFYSIALFCLMQLAETSTRFFCGYRGSKIGGVTCLSRDNMKFR